MMTLEDLKLDEEINVHFISGLMKGYNRYLQVRVAAYDELEVSHGYAYTRGNHLEDKIAKESTSSNVTFDLDNAGSWKYLKFTVNESDEKYLVIVRRQERIEETQKDLSKKNLEERERNWLYNLSKNNNHLDLSKIKTEEVTQLRLFGDNLEEQRAIFKQEELDVELDEKYDGFYILSYEINPDTYIVDDASLLMMDPQTLNLIEVEALRSLVIEYQTLIDDNLLSRAQRAIGSEEFAGEAEEYNVSVAQEEIAGDETDYPTGEPQIDDEAEEN